MACFMHLSKPSQLPLIVQTSAHILHLLRKLTEGHHLEISQKRSKCIRLLYDNNL